MNDGLIFHGITVLIFNLFWFLGGTPKEYIKTYDFSASIPLSIGCWLYTLSGIAALIFIL